MATNPKLQRLSYERVYLKVTPSSSRNNRFNCYCREKRKCRSVQRLTHESTTRLSFHHEASPCTARPSLCASISQRRWTEEKWGRGAKLKQKEERAGCLGVWTTWPTCLYSHEITYDGMTALFVFWPWRGAPIKALTLWNVQKCRETDFLFLLEFPQWHSLRVDAYSTHKVSLCLQHKQLLLLLLRALYSFTRGESSPTAGNPPQTRFL